MDPMEETGSEGSVPFEISEEEEDEGEYEPQPQEGEGYDSSQEWEEYIQEIQSPEEAGGGSDQDIDYDYLDQAVEELDPEEYMKLVKEIVESQGMNFEEWKQSMVQFFTDEEEEEGDEDDGQGDDSDGDEIEDSQGSVSASGGTGTGEEESEEGEGNNEEVEISKRKGNKIMGMKSFRYLEARILANFIKKTDDEKMDDLREKLKLMKKVKPPSVPDFRVGDAESIPLMVLKGPQASRKSLKGEAQRQSLEEDAGEGESEEDEDEDEETRIKNKGMMEFTAKQWALKNAEMFLRTAGCRSPEVSESKLETKKKDMTTTLKVFLGSGGVGEKRRGGLGSADDAPEITPALIRLAERAMWRAIINNSKPKYPLPRFILPRHKFLRRVESELIGPGSYEHDYFEKLRQKKLKSTPSMFNSCGSRFPKEKYRAPASDSLVDPYEKWDEACKRHRHPGSVPLFQSTPCNFRYKDFYIGCGIPPNYYEIKSPMQEFLKKRVSNKGMYDTGSALDSFCQRIKAPDTSSRLGPGAYEVRGSIVRDLSNKYNYFKGKISKTDRKKMFGFKAAFENPLWPVDKGFPGPTTYDPYETEDWVEPSWAPFGVLSKSRKLDINVQSKMVAPDYYYYGDGYTIDKGWRPEIFGGGMISNFVSNTPMNVPESRYVALRERNQPTNYHLDQDLILGKKETNPCGGQGH